MNNSPTIWMILGHPVHLPTALAIVAGSPKDCRFHMVISRHKYWRGIELADFGSLFASITFFEPIHYGHGLKNLWNVVKKLSSLKQQIKKLPVKPGDALISLEVWEYTENMMTSVFKNNKQILLCPEGIYSFVSLTPEKIKQLPGGHITKTGWAHNLLIEPLLGLKKRTYEYWLKTERNDHGLAYSRPVEKSYDRVFVLKSLFAKNLAENEIYYPHPLLRGPAKPAGQKRVVYFMSGYTAAPDYYKKISRILENLKNSYDGGEILELRLHPNNPDEGEKVSHDGWTINRESGNAEQYLMRHASEIVAAISHISTTLIFSLNLGVPSYSYHRAMGFEKDLVGWHDATYQDAPSEFFLESIDALPQTYEPFTGGLQKSHESIDKLLKELQYV